MKPVKKIKIEKSDLLSRYVQTLISDLNEGGYASKNVSIASYSPTGKGVSINVSYGSYHSEYHIVREQRLYRFTVQQKQNASVLSNGAPDISLPLRTFLNTINAL